MQAHHRRVATCLAVSTLACGLILLADWKSGRPSYQDSISELLLNSEKEVPKLLAYRAARDQSLANAEAAKVKSLQERLKALEKTESESKNTDHKRVKAKQVQALAGEADDAQESSTGSETAPANQGDESDGEAGKDHVLAGNTGEGYWDKNHKDDLWMPVVDMNKAVDERYEDNEKTVETRKAGSYEWNVVGDKFDDEQAERDAEGTVDNEVVQMNSHEAQFMTDDNFVPPPAELTPTHRVPMESYLPWQQEFATWFQSWMGTEPQQ